MCGLTPYHIGILTDNPFNGGGGFTPKEVGEMTLDQIYMCLTDRKVLRDRVGARTVRTSEIAAGPRMGRAADGTPIKGQVRGLSKARELMNKAEAERKAKLAAAGPKKTKRQLREEARLALQQQRQRKRT